MTKDQAEAAMAQRAPVRLVGRDVVWLISALVREPDGALTASLRQAGKARGYRRYHVSLDKLELAA